MAGPDLALLSEGLDPARGGAERAVRDLAAALTRRGVAVAVCAPRSRLGPPLEGVRVVPVDLPRLPRPAWAWRLATGLAPAARGVGARRLIACGKALGADLYWPHGGVHAEARRASAEARPPGGRRLARLGRALRPAEWAYDRIEADAYAACRSERSRAVALSSAVHAAMVRRFGLDPAAVALVPGGVAAARFGPPSSEQRAVARRALARRCGVAEGAPVALFCAHAFRLKGLDRAIRALVHAPRVTLAVAGGGRQGSFRRLARRLKVAERVALLGPVLDPVPLLWGATCALHPSRYDPCSLVVLEALACGLPVVASAADGAADLVSAPAGVVVEGDAPRPWAEALEQVQEDWADRSAAAAAARRTWDDVASDLLGLLELAPARRVP